MSEKYNVYETIIIFKPETFKHHHDALCPYDKMIREFSKSKEYPKGHACKYEDMGERALAYPMTKYEKGHYIMFRYYAEHKSIHDLECKLKTDDNVLKYITVENNDARSELEELDLISGTQTKEPKNPQAFYKKPVDVFDLIYNIK